MDLLPKKNTREKPPRKFTIINGFVLATKKNPQAKPPRKFTIKIKDYPNNIVKLPENDNDWDGNFDDKSEDSSTMIYIIELVKLIEEIYQKIISDNNSYNLELVLKNGIPELNTRYTITE